MIILKYELFKASLKCLKRMQLKFLEILMQIIFVLHKDNSYKNIYIITNKMHMMFISKFNIILQ